MNEHIMLSYFLQELTALRATGKRFSEENPHLAGHLQYDEGFGQNPQLAQLIESLVFMNARISYQFEQEYPRLISSLIDVLYPHLNAPLPSMAIIQWPAESNIMKSFSVPRGTLVETDPKVMSSARFKTVYDVKVHPIYVSKVKLLDNSELTLAGSHQEKSIIQVRLETSNPKVLLSSLDLSELQFYIHGETQITYLLYEILMSEGTAIAFVDNDDQKNPHWLDKRDFYPMGFTLNEAILPQDPRTLNGYRILSEFFALPQKFLFFKLLNLPKINEDSTFIDLYFYIKTKPPMILFQISAEQFQLGCTPIVNLFPKNLEPLEIRQQQYEYPVITDLRRPQDYEIHTIQSVTGLLNESKVETYQALFANKNKTGFFWQTRRVPCSQINGNTLNGTELMMTLTSSSPNENSAVLLIEALCTNRDLTTALSKQIALPTLQPVQGNIPPSTIRWIGRLTKSRPALFQNDNSCVLLQCQAANFLGFMSDNAQLLKNLLELYTLPEQKEFRQLIYSIENVSCERMSAFVYQTKYSGYCNGVKVILNLNQRPNENMSSWIFFNILEKLFADLLPLNSFIQLNVTVQEKELYQWPIQVGEQQLI